jgi:serine/threonine-protein kinase
MDAQREIRLLRLAIDDGVLDWPEIEKAMAEWLADVSNRDSGRDRWGPRLEALLGTGRMSESFAERLEQRLDELELTQPMRRAAVSPDGESAASNVAGGIAWDHDTEVQGRVPAAQLAAASRADELDFVRGWDRYEIVSFLGAGGMGRVYKAFDLSLKRFAALKFLRWNDPEQSERFLREARLQARVEHPNVCRVYETGQVQGRPYIAMHLIEGPALSAAAGQLNLEQKVRLLRDVARAIHAAHRTGLIHRDLKPGNILLAEAEDGGWLPYVVDFGLARDQDAHALTRTGSVSGTPAYLSPEQAQAKPLDRRTDVYSLGVVLYELICGEVPLVAGNLAASLVKIVREDPAPLSARAPSVPRDLETIVMKCLDKEPRRRYDSARALADDLTRYLDGEPILARPPTVRDRVGKWVAKNRALTAVVAVASVLLLALGGWALSVQLRAKQEAIAAQEFERLLGTAQNRIRLAHLQPLGDIRPHRIFLVAQMDEIRRRMAQLGELAEGSGNAALGRGYLELGELRLAREHLERAWQEGFRSDEVALYLGKVLGRQAQEAQLAVSTARASGSARQASIEARLEALEREYLVPARRYLAANRGGGPYLQAMSALYAHDYDRAAELARRAFEAEPLDYEPLRLETEVYLQQADEVWTHGEAEQSEALLARAGERLEQALAIARSDPRLYSEDCGRVVQLLWQREDRASAAPDALVEQALGRCDQALTADPELAEAYTNQARVHRFLAFWRGNQDLDPSAAVARVEELTTKALEFDPHNRYAYLTRSEAYRDLAAWTSARGGDPEAAYAQAAASLQRAAQVSEPTFELLREEGQIHLLRAQNLINRGQDDPDATLRQAVATLTAAHQAKPQDPSTMSSLGWAFTRLGDEARDAGRDLTDQYRTAIDWFERALAANPSDGRVSANLGSAYISIVERDLLVGSDPTADLDAAAHHLAAAEQADPDNKITLYNIGLTRRYQAEHRLATGGDTLAACAQSARALERSIEIYPGEVDTYAQLARTETVRARARMAAGSDPGAAFDAALRWVEAGEQIAADPLMLLLARAELRRRQLEWALGEGRPADPDVLASGLAAGRQAVAAAPQDHEARLALALVSLRAAQTIAADRAPAPLLAVTGGAGAAELASTAAAELAAAFEINPLLRRQYGELEAEAARLLQPAA